MPITDISTRLRGIRTSLGFNQEAMSKHVGMGIAGWKSLESEGRAPKGEVLSRLTEMGFSIDWLISGLGSMTQTEISAANREEFQHLMVERLFIITDEVRDFAESLAHHLPKGHRKPLFWADIEVRCLLISMHRQITLEAALTALTDRLGQARTPSRSAIHRFWQQLDRVRKSLARRNGHAR